MARARASLALLILVTLASALLLLPPGTSLPPRTPSRPAELRQEVSVPFRFIAYGDTRFTNPAETEASNPAVRQELVKAIADEHPAFVLFGGDIVWNGYAAQDWDEFDKETAVWQQRELPVYPVLGNHDLHGDLRLCLENYFRRFPRLQDSRYYSLRAGNTLTLALDSSQDETSGPQGDWLRGELAGIPPEVDFVFILLHHPPYTSSSDEKKFGGGHSVRPRERKLAELLESLQHSLQARIVVFASHVHNYERHERGGVTYFVSGGGGAHAYPIARDPSDPFQSPEINYHFILGEVDDGALKATMNRLEMNGSTPTWTQPDSVTISATH